MIYLARMVQAAEAQGSRVIVVPLPLYSFEIDPADLEYLAATLPESVEILDLYGQIGTDFGTFWYDDAHVVKYPAGLMTTALMARHLLTGQTVDRQ